MTMSRATARKAQIEFGESLMVIIILVFILIIGLVFYFRVSSSGLREEFAYREDIESVKLAKAALALPEIQCGDYKAHGCIDLLKLQALGELLDPGGNAKSREYYEKIFGYANISVTTIPSSGPAMTKTLYVDAPKFNYTTSQQFIFTTLYDPIEKQENFAYLNVTRFSREVTQ
jgi:hypothetical protein